jgi:ATP-dependent Clp protease ATP-binding subunit ClpA
MNGYNFTERVRKVLAMAREEAVRLGHEYVGTEHELLGIIREGEGIAATVLVNLGVDLDELQAKIEKIVKKGSPQKGSRSQSDLPYTTRAKKTLELAMSEARELNHSYVGTEHLLLGLIREKDGIGAQVLIERGVTLDKARMEVLSIIGTDSDSTAVYHAPHRAPGDSMVAVAQPHLTERVRDVLRDAEDVATEFRAAELLPIHVAIALVRSTEGFANAILDRLDADRAELLRQLTNKARNVEAATPLQPRLEFSQYMVAFQRQVESESRWRQSRPTTLNVLLVLLDLVGEVSAIFATQGIDAARVRGEARKISG